MVPFERLAVDVLVGEQAPVPWRVAGCVQPDDDHVDVGLAASVRSPCERPVSEGDLQAVTVEEQWPELSHLLALRDRVGRHKADPRRCLASGLRLLHVVSGPDEPRGHVVERPAATAKGGDAVHLRPLFGRLELGPAERRIGPCQRL